MAKFVSYIATGEAITKATIMISVISIVRMTLRAMGFGRLPFRNLLRAITSQGICSAIHYFQVVGINTGWISAKMVYFQTLRDYTPCKFIRQTVCRDHGARTILSTACSKATITLPVPCGKPKPALLGIKDRNFHPKATRYIHISSIADGLKIVNPSNSIV